MPFHLEKAKETLNNQSQERNNWKVISMLENLTQKLQKKKKTRVASLHYCISHHSLSSQRASTTPTPLRPSANHRVLLIASNHYASCSRIKKIGGSNKKQIWSGTPVIRTGGVTWGVEIFGRYLHLHVAVPIKIIISFSFLVPAQIARLWFLQIAPWRGRKIRRPSALAGIVGAEEGLEAAAALVSSFVNLPPFSCLIVLLRGFALIQRRELLVSVPFSSLRTDDLGQLQRQNQAAASWKIEKIRRHLEAFLCALKKGCCAVSASSWASMGFLSLVGNSFGCSASGERLVSAARDGDLQEARALLEYNPRLARYSTFGGRNSPLHYAAAQGHHEIVSLLLESGVEINLRNYRGQTALMQACQYGHWEVVQTLILFNANVHRTDYLNGGTAIHFAALHGHARCLRLVLADYVPSVPNFCTVMNHRSSEEDSALDFDHDGLVKMVNQKADGGLTPLHMAALNGHVECVQLLLDLGASVSEVTIEDGTTIDIIGAGSTPLHYAACGGNAVCCQLLIARGACITVQNASGWTPVMVARSWQRNSIEEILSKEPVGRIRTLPSPYLCLPLMSIMNIARECGWRYLNQSPVCIDPCAVCLEGSCSVAAEGCKHEFCTRCALYLCSTSYTSVSPAGAIPCPLCRHPIISFIILPGTSPIRELPRNSLSLSFCTTCPAVNSDSSAPIAAHLYRTEFQCGRMPLMGSYSFRSLSCQRIPAMKLNPSFCMGSMDTNPCLIRCSRFGSSLQRSASQGEETRRAWPVTFNPIVATGS